MSYPKPLKMILNERLTRLGNHSAELDWGNLTITLKGDLYLEYTFQVIGRDRGGLFEWAWALKDVPPSAVALMEKARRKRLDPDPARLFARSRLAAPFPALYRLACLVVQPFPLAGIYGHEDQLGTLFLALTETEKD